MKYQIYTDEKNASRNYKIEREKDEDGSESITTIKGTFFVDNEK